MMDDTLPTLAQASRILWRAYVTGAWLGAPRAQPVLYAFERELWFSVRDHLAAQLPAQVTERSPRRLPTDAIAAGVGVLILLDLIRGRELAPSGGANLLAPPRFQALGEQCAAGALATQIAAAAAKAADGDLRCSVPLAVWMNASAGIERRGLSTGLLHGPLARRALLEPDIEQAMWFGESLFTAGRRGGTNIPAGAVKQPTPLRLRDFNKAPRRAR
jgi:hypothetical protein